MLITAFNHRLDCLFAVVGQDSEFTETSETKGRVTVIRDTKTGTLVGVNFFAPAQILGSDALHDGQVQLGAADVAKLNAALAAAGFSDRLEADTKPRFVIGFVKELKKHPNSDHLKIAQVDDGEDKLRQIVVGSPNVAEGQKVVVALPGAFMPSGKIIWPGELRGVSSYGMLCAPRELALPNAPQKPGLLILPEDAEVGAPFEPAKLDLHY
ncbi:YtpR family tRNA-binding protein [Schleiferilactobacillus shenzhenensis]|uniref:YtpR family tRNA-binding protein n=1 Tax=Schleiferilactobacillus shenzhenensis TaxID=1231337 RepID=UPI0003F936AF|nr:DUF4479 domain-containing protein [Schleiferilactobacillus shenzhenensis]